jgi:hypothetical protein
MAAFDPEGRKYHALSLLKAQGGSLSADRWVAGENRQLIVESTLVGGQRFAAGDIG